MSSKPSRFRKVKGLDKAPTSKQQLVHLSKFHEGVRAECVPAPDPTVLNSMIPLDQDGELFRTDQLYGKYLRFSFHGTVQEVNDLASNKQKYTVSDSKKT